MFNFRRKRNQLTGRPARDYSPSSKESIEQRQQTIDASSGVEENVVKNTTRTDGTNYSKPSLVTDVHQRQRPSSSAIKINTNNSSSMSENSDDLCSGFEAQAWKKDRCKKCFRLKEQHNVGAALRSIPIEIQKYELPKLNRPESAVNGGGGGNPKVLTKTAGAQGAGTEKNISKIKPKSSDNIADVSATYILAPADQPSSQQDAKRRTKLVILKAEVSVDGKPSEEVSMETSIMADSPSRRSLSPPDESYRSAASSAADYATASSGYDPLSRTVSWESVASTILDDDKASMVTAVSGGTGSERSCRTPTESLDRENVAASYAKSLKSQLENAERRCAQLAEENDQLKIIHTADQATKELMEKLKSAENLCRDFRDENQTLKRDLRHLQESTVKRVDETERKALKSALTAAQQLCEELMEENGALKTDVYELSEMHDQYREEEIEEFRELQHELDQTAKNCRVLQFKLRKSERKCDQTEADRRHLEEKLKEYLVSSNANEPTDSPRVREIESELRIAKEVSVRLHNELEVVDEKRCKLEDENFYLREKVREIETREKLVEQSLLKQDQQKKLSGATKASPSVAKELSPTAVGLSGYQNGVEYNMQQLLRDLKDALERETDLREQLKFAEEDIQAARKKLSDMETENDGLVQQLTKLTANVSGSGGGRSKGGKPPMKRSYSEGHAQIELELAEHETQVLKSKLDRMEKENENLLSKNDLLAKEVKKVGGKTEFSEDDFQATFPDTYYKHKIKMLEEEINDWKLKFETIQKTEADQDTARRIVKVGRSRSSDSSELDLHRKLELVEQEAGVLRLRIKDLELENERPRLHGFVLCGENKRLHLVRKSSGKSNSAHSLLSEASNSNNGVGDSESLKLKEKLDQTQKDIHRFINRIAELEKEKEALNKEVDRRKKLESIKKESYAIVSAPATKVNLQTASQSELRTKVQDLVKENANLKEYLNGEQKKLNELETQLADYKQIISQSENQKLITMASKIDVLTNQLKEAQTRFENMQKKMAGQSEKKYEEVMKEQIEYLEKSLTEEKNRVKLQQDEETSQELIRSNQLIKFVEQKVDLLCKQIEKIESQQSSPKPSPRVNKYGRSVSQTLTPPSGSGGDSEKILKDLASLKIELDSLKSKISDGKVSKIVRTPSAKSAKSMSTSISSSSFNSADQTLATKCQQQDKLIEDLKEQLEVSKRERVSAYYECETATARLLQTEDRWSKELDKLKEHYENQLKDLSYNLKEAEKIRDEKISLWQERESILQEKSRRSTEIERKLEKLESELKNKHKDLQEKLDVEKRKAKDFETKYQKLENLYENDRQKLTNEKDKLKQDNLEAKKRQDEIQSEFDKFKMAADRKEQAWQKDRTELETKIKNLQDDVKEVEKKVTKKAVENASFENKKLLSELSLLKKKTETDSEEWKVERSNLQTIADQKSRDLEFRLDELERMKKETNLLKSRILDQKQQLEETRNMRDEAREELSRWQQTWTREKAELTHKKRQEEKVQIAEQHAMQLKYESRMKILEDSSKRVQIQLTQIRRERDQIRENLVSTEKKLSEMKDKYESDEKGLKQDISDIVKKGEIVDELKAQLEKEMVDRKVLQKNYDIDRRLWSVEREQYMIKIQNLESGTSAMLSVRSRSMRGSSPTSPTKKDEKEKLLEQAVEIGNQMRHQLDEVKETYDQEINNYRQQIERNKQDFSKERVDMQRKLKELQENARIVDIDRRNILSMRDEHELDKNLLSVERDNLMEKFHDSEIHQLANKYKLDKVAEQLANLQSKLQQSEVVNKKEINDVIKKVGDQLSVVRDDMGKAKELGKLLDSIEFADETASVSSRRSGGSRRSTQKLELDITEERGGVDNRSDRSPRSLKKETVIPVGEKNDGSSFGRTLSSTDSNYEARLAELRFRSTSPAPRKITNYPDPPPSIIFNVKNAVQYNDDGSRYWARRSQIKRSTSFDPAPVSTGSFDISDMEESKSTRSRARDASSDAEDSRRGGVSEDTDLSSTGSQSPRSRRKIIDIFATLRKRKSKDRRKLFGHTKANSIETSGVGQTISAIAVQMFPPAVTPANLPESMQTSSKLDEPPRLAKSSSGSNLFNKLRRRSKDRLHRQSASVDSGSDAPSGQSTPSGIGSKTNSQDNVLPTKERYASSLAPTPSISSTSRNVSSNTSAFRRLTTSYRSLSAKYLSRI